jgi:hypothetical protein
MSTSHAERGRRSKAARAETIAGTRPITRPGSERTSLRVGDEVRVTRAAPPSGTWSRYQGREGWVVVLNRQRFPDGRGYVEIGVAWSRRGDIDNARADSWFRADELELVTR